MGSWIISVIKIVVVVIIIEGYLQYRKEKKEAEQAKLVYTNKLEKSSDKLKLLDKER